MTFIKNILLVVVFVALSLTNAYARKASGTELKTLKEQTDTYITALKKGDVEVILNAIPPQIIDSLATDAKLDKVQFHQIMTSQMQKLTSTYVVEQFKANDTRKKFGELTNGNPYYIIPVEFVLLNNSNNDKSRIKGELIAILENNQWYFVRADDATMLATMTKLFPGFEKIKLTSPDIKKLN